MNASARLLYVADSGPAPRFNEVDEVRLKRAQESRSGVIIPAGTVGTVMMVMAEGAAYTVEFGDTPDMLLTVGAEDLAPTTAE